MWAHDLGTESILHSTSPSATTSAARIDPRPRSYRQRCRQCNKMDVADRPQFQTPRKLWVALAVVAAIGYGIYSLSSRHHAGPTADQVAQAIGATSCESSGYAILNQLTGKKTEIFDCVRYGTQVCVTMQGGVASDATVETRLAFANAFGSKPACLKG